jgi:GT2 family glycosyltransferase
MSQPELSIVILTWNSRVMLEACLAALPAATAGLCTEVIVIDNGSHDGTAESLDGRVGVTLIRNPRNRGVAAGRNQGLRAARGDFVALLDVDAEPAPAALTTLVAHLRRAPGVALAGPKLVGRDGRLQYSCRRFPTAVDKLLRRLPARWGERITDDVDRWWDHASVRQVDHVIGACQVIRRRARRRWPAR